MKKGHLQEMAITPPFCRHSRRPHRTSEKVAAFIEPVVVVVVAVVSVFITMLEPSANTMRDQTMSFVAVSRTY
jgi:hypothetical protein